MHIFPSFSSPNLKNSLFCSFSSLCGHSDTVYFRVQKPDCRHPYLTMPNRKLFNRLIIFVNLYQHAKNEAISSICSREIVDLKVLQSDWLRAFWPKSQEEDFSQYRICAGRNTANNINFHYRTNTVKINKQIFL